MNEYKGKYIQILEGRISSLMGDISDHEYRIKDNESEIIDLKLMNEKAKREISEIEQLISILTNHSD